MTLNTKKLADEIATRLRAAGDQARRRVGEGYAPTAMEIFGARTPDLRAIVRDAAKRLDAASAAEVLELAHRLVATRTFEGRQAAYELLARHRQAMAALDGAALERLGEGIDNWASVDTFACLVAGPAWRAGSIPDELADAWARSDDRWWRRAAVVCTVALNMRSRGGRGDVERTLRLCGLLAADRDDMVAKGVSWALRELIAHDRAAVEEFLAERKAVLPARLRREVRHKLETGLKTPRRPGAARVEEVRCAAPSRGRGDR
jgi:3-methyladenine DNA glycosylase AlkD